MPPTLASASTRTARNPPRLRWSPSAWVTPAPSAWPVSTAAPGRSPTSRCAAAICSCSVAPTAASTTASPRGSRAGPPPPPPRAAEHHRAGDRTFVSAMEPIADRVDGVPWTDVGAGLDDVGVAPTGSLLTVGECRALVDTYGDDARFRST